MADAVKSRKRSSKSVYVDDSDDDFSDPAPSSRPSKQAKKKHGNKEKAVVYTSTQDDSSDVTKVGRKSRVSAAELKFMKEIEEALRLSADETASSAEIITVEKNTEHNPSSADTIDINDLNLTEESGDKDKEAVPDVLSAGLSEKEVWAGHLNHHQMDDDFKENKSPVKKFEAKPRKKDGWIVADRLKEIKAEEKNVDTSTDEESGKQICVVAQVHKTDQGEERAKTAKLDPVMEIVEADDEQDESPSTKRKRKTKMQVIESDSEDEDFGAEDIKELSDEEDCQSDEDEYKPAKKKSKQTNKKSKTSPRAENAKQSKKKKTPTKKKGEDKGKITLDKEKDKGFTNIKTREEDKPVTSPGPNLVRPGGDKKNKVGEPAPDKSSSPSTKISAKLPTVPASSKLVSLSSPATPVLGKGKSSGLGTGFSKVKIPSWTPPAKVGSSSVGGGKTGGSVGLSPAGGVRLGLSRNVRVLKPLHSSVKNST